MGFKETRAFLKKCISRLALAALSALPPGVINCVCVCVMYLPRNSEAQVLWFRVPLYFCHSRRRLQHCLYDLAAFCWILGSSILRVRVMETFNDLDFERGCKRCTNQRRSTL